MKLIGLDVGTTSCKAIVFDAAGGILGRASREYPVNCGAAGKAEQDAEEVWSLVKETLREVAAKAGAKDILALGVSVQGDAIIPVDRTLRALHPAILGMDYRSAPQAERCASILGAFSLFEQTGMRPHPVNALAKVLWLREMAPAIFDRTAKIMTYEDFILGKLGGEPTIDYTMASRTMAFELGNGRWSDTIHNALTLDASIWSKPAASGTPIGTISPAMAAELGLPAGLALATGGHDQTCAALGAGAIREGLGVVSTGTAEVLSTALARPVLTEAMFNSYYPCYRHVLDGTCFTFSLNHVGGILLKWWRDNFGVEATAEAARTGWDAYQWMDAHLPAGPSPVLFLPHLNGSGTPWCDMRSKGAVVGLTLATTRHDVAKAMLEGLAFELRKNLETMRTCGLGIEEIVAVGGGAKSAVWLQVKADILNRPLRTLRCGEAACLGAALLAGTAAGVYRHPEEAVAQTVHYEREIIPLPDRVAAYSERYAAYRQIYPALQALHATL
jgi:sugar (pentulose or hexulose) kinase